MHNLYMLGAKLETVPVTTTVYMLITWLSWQDTHDQTNTVLPSLQDGVPA